MQQSNLALVLAGPMLRHTSSQRIVFWLACSEVVELSLTLHFSAQTRQLDALALAKHCQSIAAGERLHYYLLDIQFEEELPTDTWISYDLQLTPPGHSRSLGWQQWAPGLTYPSRDLPGFVICSKVKRMLHGSCRKPHHPSDDGLVAADAWLANTELEQWPSLLMMSGDQIYADDVATPMLVAIHGLLERLGLANESFESSSLNSSEVLHRQGYYLSRQQLLPKKGAEQAAKKALFSGVRKPIFTSDHANNHLISLAEMLAMYLLVWAPGGWQDLAMSPPEELALDELDEYLQQREILQRFIQGLAKVQRLMAHLPCAMMFDDHDVTDDWNLSAAWELSAYGHPFSKRIIGNAMVAYFLCQGWGNAPDNFPAAFIEGLRQSLAEPGGKAHQHLIERLLSHSQWHYCWDTQPALLVLDTRTQRWRSERNLDAPSGLMDWEALSELQQQLLGLDAAILVSPAPIFGVKLIEVIQRLFTWLGKPLLVDAENWMAHPGAANSLLNMFRHGKTPQHFVLLSGDVHYSFVYQIQLRRRQQGPEIWQITSSGIKNQFPEPLLSQLDRLNRWLYSPRSPLNWFTKRRRMKVIPHRPENAASGERLLNASGVGLLALNSDGSPQAVWQLTSKGELVAFAMDEQQARWE